MNFKYTGSTIECNSCSRANYFSVLIIKKDEKYYYLTQCPKCKSYDECREMSVYEVKQYQLHNEG